MAIDRVRTARPGKASLSGPNPFEGNTVMIEEAIAPALVPAVVREFGPADYRTSPDHAGSEQVAALFPGFKHQEIRTRGAVIRLRHGGAGPPLLLLHGNPQNHVCWHRVGSRLAAKYHVILPDLRGYGDSSLPPAGEKHVNFSFRAMANDMCEIMDVLGHQTFFVAGHDRGGRTAHRLTIDHPERVRKLCLLDILPNHFVWNNVDKDWVIRTWHWSFMAQPEPLPERMISAVPAEYFLKSRMVIRGGTGLGFLTAATLAEYVRCYTLKTISGSCRDYRATATSDFEIDTADADRKIDTPLLLLWGARGISPPRSGAFGEVWRHYASNIVDAEPLDCGHYIPEERPDRVVEHFERFFVAP